MNDAADYRTLVLLRGLDHLLEAYDSDITNDTNLAKIVGTIRWLNSNFNKDELTKFIEKTSLSYKATIQSLLTEPLFYIH